MIPDLCRNPDASRAILERGIFYLGDTRWNIAFYLGTIYTSITMTRKRQLNTMLLHPEYRGEQP